MPRLRDWWDMASGTIRNLQREEVADLYKVEWKSAEGKLTAEFRDEIDRHGGRFRRSLRRTNAVIFGLTRRLAPARRLFLLIALICVLLSLSTGSNFSYAGHHFTASFAFNGCFLFIAFVLTLLLLAMELVDKLNYRDELVLARELQSHLLPQKLPALPGFELAAFNRVANMVGGDLYEFVPLPGGELALLFGDAAGHGMTAGLVMAVAHAGFRTQLEVDYAPTAMMTTLNKILVRTGGTRSFFSGMYFLIQPDGSFVAVVAGHPPAFLVGPDGAIRQQIGKGSYPLGIKDGVPREPVPGKIETRETLFICSDGLAEARNDAQEQFGDARVELLLRQTAGRSPAEIIDVFKNELAAFCGRRPPEDDVSIVTLRKI